MKNIEMFEREERVYLVLEYLEKINKQKRILVIRHQNKDILDVNTMNFDTKELLAALYYQWCNINAEGPKSSLKDIYSVGEDTMLGNYLTSLLEDKRIEYGLRDTSFVDINVTKEYLNIKDNCHSQLNNIKLLRDRQADDFRLDYCDRVPNVILSAKQQITVPKRVRK